MHFYRAMSLDEYKKFLSGEQIMPAEDRWKTGKMCMMPAMACMGEKEIVESLYRVYPNMSGIVNPEVFVKFEIDSDKLREMVDSGQAKFAATKYDTVVGVRELQMNYYDNSFCRPQSIAFAADSFLSTPAEKINWYTESQVTLENIDSIWAREMAINKLGGYNIDYKTDSFRYMSGSKLSPIYSDYKFAWVYASGVDSSSFLREIESYNFRNGEVFSNSLGGITYSLDYFPKQSIDFPVEFYPEFSTSAKELKDLVYFQHSKNFVEMFSKATGTEVPTDLKNIMNAMESGLSSPYRYSINIDGESKDIMDLRLIENDSFRAENIIVSGSAVVPTWKIYDKVTDETYYVSTELLVDKCNEFGVNSFVYGKEIFTSNSLEFSKEIKEISSVDEFNKKSEDISREFHSKGLDDIYQRLFSECEGVKPNDLFLGYTINKSDGLAAPIVCFKDGQYILGIDNYLNPENICVMKADGSVFRKISIDGCSFEDAISAVQSVANNQPSQYWKYLSIIQEAVDSVRQVENVQSENIIEQNNIVGPCGGYYSFMYVTDDIFSANLKDSYIVSNGFNYSGLEFSFDFIDGAKFLSDEYECTITSSKDGYMLKISSETIEFIDEYSSIKDALCKISEICCSEYNLHREEYPVLSQLDYSGKIFERVFSSDFGSYTEGSDFASFDFGNGLSMTVDTKSFIFYKEENGVKVETERVDVSSLRDYDKAIEIFDSVAENIRENDSDFGLEM